MDIIIGLHRSLNNNNNNNFLSNESIIADYPKLRWRSFFTVLLSFEWRLPKSLHVNHFAFPDCEEIIEKKILKSKNRGEFLSKLHPLIFFPKYFYILTIQWINKMYEIYWLNTSNFAVYKRRKKKTNTKGRNYEVVASLLTFDNKIKFYWTSN